MRQVVKVIVLYLKVSVPVSAPAHLDVKRFRRFQYIASEQVEAADVLPVYRVWHNIYRPAGDGIVLALSKARLALSVQKGQILLPFSTVATDNGAVEGFHNLVEEPLKVGMAGGEPFYGCFRKLWHMFKLCTCFENMLKKSGFLNISPPAPLDADVVMLIDALPRLLLAVRAERYRLGDGAEAARLNRPGCRILTTRQA